MRRIFRILIVALTVAVMILPCTSASAKRVHGPNPSDPVWYFYGHIWDSNMNPVQGWVYIEYYSYLYPGQFWKDIVHTRSDGIFELKPSAPPLNYDENTLFRMVVGSESRGFWSEERILHLPQQGGLSFFLWRDNDVRVPLMVQYSDCPQSGVTTASYKHAYAVQPVFSPNNDAPSYGWTTKFMPSDPGGGTYTGTAQSTSGQPMYVMGCYKSTGIYYVRNWDSISGRYVYGNYWDYTEAKIVQSNLYGVLGKWITEGGKPLTYLKTSGPLDDYVSASEALPGELVRSLSPGEVWVNSFQASGSLMLSGPLAIVSNLHLGGGIFYGLSRDIAAGLDTTISLSGARYLVSYSVTCTSDGVHTYKIWVDNLVVHIWKVS